MGKVDLINTADQWAHIQALEEKMEKVLGILNAITLKIVDHEDALTVLVQFVKEIQQEAIRLAEEKKNDDIPEAG